MSAQQASTTPQNTASLLAAYDPKLTIYVEGADDVVLFRDWMFPAEKSRTPRLEFVSPAAGGCQVVISLVNATRIAQTGRVYGILDRDALVSSGHVSLFVDPDDAKLGTAPLGKYLHVLTRWEIENFMAVDLELLTTELAQYQGSRTASVDDTSKTVMAVWELLRPYLAAAIWCRQQPAPPPFKNTFALEAQTAAEMRAKCETHLGSGFTSACDVSLAVVDAFDNPAADPQARWRAVNRIIDGKRLLRELLRASGCKSPDEVGKFSTRMAERLERAHRIDPEITGAIEAFAKLP